MFQNFLKIAWRNLFRNKGFLFTNILGLAIGMTCTLLIFLWVQDELSYNKFHEHYNRIYRAILLLTLAVVGATTITAAIRKPVKSLRDQ